MCGLTGAVRGLFPWPCMETRGQYIIYRPVGLFTAPWQSRITTGWYPQLFVCIYMFKVKVKVVVKKKTSFLDICLLNHPPSGVHTQSMAERNIQPFAWERRGSRGKGVLGRQGIYICKRENSKERSTREFTMATQLQSLYMKGA